MKRYRVRDLESDRTWICNALDADAAIQQVAEDDHIPNREDRLVAMRVDAGNEEPKRGERVTCYSCGQEHALRPELQVGPEMYWCGCSKS